MSRTVVITGVSTGIGHATAQSLIARGYRVFGSVRKAADGERVREQLGAALRFAVFSTTFISSLCLLSYFVGRFVILFQRRPCRYTTPGKNCGITGLGGCSFSFLIL
jgi:NAD(P)-dependent dehydrogenase (short-subunit alcohol dehydrogenase family)